MILLPVTGPESPACCVMDAVIFKSRQCSRLCCRFQHVGRPIWLDKQMTVGLLLLLSYHLAALNCTCPGVITFDPSLSESNVGLLMIIDILKQRF